MINMYLYTRYERFWHWLQMALIFVLLVTGFEVHGSFPFPGIQPGCRCAQFRGADLADRLRLFHLLGVHHRRVEAVHPHHQKDVQVVRYYSYGIFKGESHPVPKRKDAKHNPLQRIVYLSLAAFLLPVQMLSGFLYWGYNSWNAWGLDWLTLDIIALVHMAGAFAILCFIIVHVYMTTTGHTVTAHVKAMITGWEDVEEGEVQEWEKHGDRQPAASKG
jgi:thiosulfate reductase cytochrome b subunit